MIKTRQTIHNNKNAPIYISIEPTPECYELEPGETLTLLYNLTNEEEVPALNVTDEGIVVTPFGAEPEVLINGNAADGRSWKFKHL